MQSSLKITNRMGGVINGTDKARLMQRFGLKEAYHENVSNLGTRVLIDL